jgi:hypothetical protein
LPKERYGNAFVSWHWAVRENSQNLTFAQHTCHLAHVFHGHHTHPIRLPRTYHQVVELGIRKSLGDDHNFAGTAARYSRTCHVPVAKVSRDE